MTIVRGKYLGDSYSLFYSYLCFFLAFATSTPFGTGGRLWRLWRWFPDGPVRLVIRVEESRVQVEMVHQVPLQIRQRLAEVLPDLKSVVGQQAANVYLTHILASDQCLRKLL